MLTFAQELGGTVSPVHPSQRKELKWAGLGNASYNILFWLPSGIGGHGQVESLAEFFFMVDEHLTSPR
jgi:hypothetical protein